MYIGHVTLLTNESIIGAYKRQSLALNPITTRCLLCSGFTNGMQEDLCKYSDRLTTLSRSPSWSYCSSIKSKNIFLVSI